jgi:hypothetical protein
MLPGPRTRNQQALQLDNLRWHLILFPFALTEMGGAPPASTARPSACYRPWICLSLLLSAPLSSATCRCRCSFTLLYIAHRSRSFAGCYASRTFYTQPVTPKTLLIHRIRYFRPFAELLGRTLQDREETGSQRLLHIHITRGRTWP